MIVFDERYCKGCGICVRFCPKKILEITDRMNARGYFMPRILDEGQCNQCRNCELFCPDFAVFLMDDEDANG